MKGDTMKDTYKNANAAEAFAVGFKRGGYVYGFLCDAAFALSYARTDKTSKKHGRKACLRLYITAAEQRRIEQDAKKYFPQMRLCTVEQFEAMKKPSENDGHVFERLIREKYHGTPCKCGGWWKTADFTLPEDFTYHTKEWKPRLIQAKFQGGTFCTAEECRKVK